MMIKVEWEEYHRGKYEGHVIQFVTMMHGDVVGIIILPDGRFTVKRLHELKVVEV